MLYMYLTVTVTHKICIQVYINMNNLKLLYCNFGIFYNFREIKL